MKNFLLTLFAFFLFSNVYAQNATQTLTIGATALPHAEILEFVKDDLKKEGIDLKIVEFSDYITPNIALNDGSIDANYFQHLPYLESFIKGRNMDLVPVFDIHIEASGLYSSKYKSLDEIKNKALIAVPNDPTNEGRAFLLLQANGLIELDPAAGIFPTPKSITKNPKNLRFIELEAAQIPRSLKDVDAAVINANYALVAGFNPTQDAIIIEGGESPYVNVVAVRRESYDDPRFKILSKVLLTDKVRDFINKKYNGSVVPTF